MLDEIYKNAASISVGSAMYAYEKFGTIFTVTDGAYIELEREEEE